MTSLSRRAEYENWPYELADILIRGMGELLMRGAGPTAPGFYDARPSIPDLRAQPRLHRLTGADPDLHDLGIQQPAWVEVRLRDGVLQWGVWLDWHRTCPQAWGRSCVRDWAPLPQVPAPPEAASWPSLWPAPDEDEDGLDG